MRSRERDDNGAVGVAQIDEVSEAVERLATALAGRDGTDEALARVATVATWVLPGAAGVSVTVRDPGGPRTVTSTVEAVRELDGHQYADDRGPCMDAAREGRVIAAGPSVAARRWPGFTEAARACGYHSFLSAPLFVGDGSATRGTSTRGTEADGSVNVYGRDEDAFDDVDHARVRLLCATASAAIGGSRQLVRLTETIAALHRALESRAEIDQAIGVLAAVRGLSAEEGFSALVAESQRTNRKLHAVARDLMERTRAGPARRPRGTEPAHR